MALRIKITRIGGTNNPKYRIIVAEARSKRDGRYVDKIGFYDPIPDPHVLEIGKERLDYWIKNGAKLSQKALRDFSKNLSRNMKNLLAYIIEHIVDDPKAVKIEEELDGDITRFNVTIAENDYPHIIGKGGLTIQAITDIIRTAQSRKSDAPARVFVNIVSPQQ